MRLVLNSYLEHLMIVPGSADFVTPIVRRGSKVDALPDISVIVIAIRGDRRVIDAVHSLYDPAVRTEVILVNTGYGSIAGTLGPLIEEVVLVECDRLHLPGGARNLGLS